MSSLLVNTDQAFQSALAQHEARREQQRLPDGEKKTKCPQLGSQGGARLVDRLRENAQRHARELSSAGIRP